MPEFPQVFAVLLTRILLGMLFLSQGYDKLFGLKPSAVLETFEPAFRNKGINSKFLLSAIYLTSILELAGGFLLILGLLKYPALNILGIDLIIVSIGFSIISPVWDLKHVFPGFLLLLILLLLPPEWDIYSFDNFLNFNY